MIHNLIDKFTDLQRIKKSPDIEKEIDYRIKVTRQNRNRLVSLQKILRFRKCYGVKKAFDLDIT